VPAAAPEGAVGGDLRDGDAIPATGSSSRFAFSIAADADDAGLCRLLSVPFPGAVHVSLERAPSPTRAGAVDGDVHQLIVARKRETGELVGMASRSVRDLYVNGRSTRVGYLGQLRFQPGCRSWRAVLDEGFAVCRHLHERGDAPFYLTSVAADNGAARRLLRRPPSRRAPAFLELTALRTFAIPTTLRRRAPAPAARLERGSDALLPGIVECLHRNLSRYQFAPHWTTADIGSERTRHLLARHFVVALDGNRVIGCLARWDQTAFKQVVIRGYSRRLSRWRPLVNAAGRWLGVPPLPPIGAALRCAFLSHAAVDEDRADVFLALVDEQRRRAAADGARHVVTAFAAGHPFHAALTRAVRSRTYDSVLYLSGWDDADRIVRSLDGRLFQPEVAVL
jgi:hypothetical protein